MKSRAGCRRRSFVLLAALFVLAPLATGCSSANQKHGAMKGALKDFRTGLTTFDAQVEASVRAVERLQSQSTYDVPKAYQQFLTEYMNVGADAREVDQSAEAMRTAGADYYVEARKEAERKKDASAGEELQQRQAATREQYNALQDRLGDLRESTRVYLLELEGVRRAIERDPTRQGVAMTATPLLEARDQAGRVRKAAAAAIEQTDVLADTAAAPTKK